MGLFLYIRYFYWAQIVLKFKRRLHEMINEDEDDYDWDRYDSDDDYRSGVDDAMDELDY